MSTPSPSPTLWSNPRIAQQYRHAEPITGAFARRLIQQAGVIDSEAPLVVLDNACGTGIVAEHLLGMVDDRVREMMRVVCGDFSEGMVGFVRGKIGERGWRGVEARVVDAMKTGLPDEYFTHVLTNFGIMLMPDPDAVLNESLRMLKPGGVCALSTWTTVGWISDMRAAFATLPCPAPFPDTKTFMDSWGKGAWYDSEFVRKQLTTHGFMDVKVEIVQHRSTVKNGEEFCEAFLMMIEQIVQRYWTDEERKTYEGSIKGALLKYLAGKYGEGVIELNWEAILATGRKTAL